MKNKNYYNQELKQKNQLSISMQESLRILQMPIEDLCFWLQEKITQNPLLEWGEEEVDEHEDRQYFHQRFDGIEQEVPYHMSCFEYLMSQASQTFKKKTDLKMAEWIIGNLDKEGFYTLPLDSLPSSFEKESFIICLEKIKHFDPLGIGSSCLQENLLLQLQALGKKNNLSYLIIENHIEDILKGNLLLIQKKLKIDKKVILQAIQKDVSSLNPFPGYKFHKKEIPPLSIDVFLIEEEGTFRVQVKKPPLPKEKNEFSFNTCTQQEKSIIRTYKKEAKWLINALEKRNSTLQKITEYLIQKQREYLEGTSEVLAPLSIRNAGEELGLHESTIARAVADKNLFCSLGIIHLKSLFSKSLSDTVSCDKAYKILLKLITEEDKSRPLSDRELLEKMKQRGIPCARRTITKYRNQLSIPSKYERKSP